MLPCSDKEELEEIHSLPATSFECCKLVLKVISATDYSCNFCIVSFFLMTRTLSQEWVKFENLIINHVKEVITTQEP